jgi:hypothetical protein
LCPRQKIQLFEQKRKKLKAIKENVSNLSRLNVNFSFFNQRQIIFFEDGETNIDFHVTDDQRNAAQRSN